MDTSEQAAAIYLGFQKIFWKSPHKELLRKA